MDPAFIEFPSTNRSERAGFSQEGMRKRSTGGPPVRRKLSPLGKGNPPAPSVGNVSLNGIKAGIEVEHERFGKGKVLKVEGDKATVFFPNVGQKQLLLKFARLTILK